MFRDISDPHIQLPQFRKKKTNTQMGKYLFQAYTVNYCQSQNYSQVIHISRMDFSKPSLEGI